MPLEPKAGLAPGLCLGAPKAQGGGGAGGRCPAAPRGRRQAARGRPEPLYLRLGAVPQLWRAGEQPGQVRCAEPPLSVLSHRLQWCRLSESCCAELAALLAEQPGLARLELADSSLGDSGVRLLCQGLRAPGCRLRILR